MIDLLRRLHRMDGGRRALLAEAVIFLVCARVGLRFVSLSTLRRMLRRRQKLQGQPVAAIAWAVHAVGQRTGATCLVEALAADSMLRHHGHHSVLKLGIHGDGVRATPEAHAWVECGDTVVTGRVDNLERYAVLS